MPTGIADIPDDLLELVLLRVRTPACLFRAAATCKLWRRVIARDGFLHRFRSRHGHSPHLLLGHYVVTTDPYTDTMTAEFVPTPPPPAVRLRQCASLDFLIQPDDGTFCRQVLTDSRGGLLAFVRDNSYAVVCLGAYFLDAGSSSSSTMSSFRLLCACVITDDYDDDCWVESCVFSARDNRWVSHSTHVGDEEVSSMCALLVYDAFVGRAGGSSFWAGGYYNHVVALDESTGEFSNFELPLSPRGPSGQNLRVVAGGAAGAVHLFHLVDDGILEVLTASRAAAHGDWECTLETSVGLYQPVANIIEAQTIQSWWFIDTGTTTAGMLVLKAFLPSSGATLMFSLDVETTKLQPVTNTTTYLRVFPYERPWPQTI
ncbi:hypothetical protein BS78_08G145600 [Paspalum vaginatum]|nr:hypothetical protein BS78_08G145600 [Paspalum vaginatum]